VAIQRQLRKRLTSFFNKYADPKWDVWRGGKTKARLLTQEKFPQFQQR
jgi:hypothetical protein